jgi:arginine decarboxylase
MALNFGSMEIFLTTGKGVGRTPIAAFDSALKDAGVYNYNLIYLSSVIPPKTKIKFEKLQENPKDWGNRLYVVKAEMRSRQSGKYIGAALGWYQWEDGRGIFVEHEETGETRDAVEANLRAEVEKSLSDMCKSRGVPVEKSKFHTKICTTKVDNLPASVMVIAAYKTEKWG